MDHNVEQLIFIDQSAKVERTFIRLYVYSPINTRAKKSVVFIRGKCYTILPALSLEGFIAVDIMEGSCDKERFQTFIFIQLVNIIFILFLYNYLKFLLIFTSFKLSYLK